MGVDRQSPPSPELKVFSDRLQKAMEFKKIDVAVLAKNLEYKPGDIHKMLAGMREPSLKKLMLLANSLGCSVDFLLGLTPEAKRASVVVEVDMDAKKPQLSERGQTSGQISGKVERFIAMMPELLESDVELLMYLAGFLIDRKGKMLAKIMGAVAEKPPKEAESLPQISHSKNNDDLSDGDFDEEDDLWEDIEDDEFEDADFEEDDFEDEDDDFDEDDFEDE
jgi:transcriptional regulator with XRE-family HTH domain